MVPRGPKRTPCVLLTLAFVIAATTVAFAWDGQNRYPIKVRIPRAGAADFQVGGMGIAARDMASDWESAAGAAPREILCPRRGFAFALGMRPFFSNLSGSVKATSKGGEGTLLNLHGHLRIPAQNTLWEVYSYLRMWDKITVRLEYVPWNWSGPGHAGTDGNFAGLLLVRDDLITSSLNITSFRMGADYDVSWGRDLVFGPNVDFHIIKWNQRVTKDAGGSQDFAQTILQPAIGAHVRYEPSHTGYFSWFKPTLEARFSWMSLNGLGLSMWDIGAGIAPPLSRNVDAGFKLGYKQWKLDGYRGRLLLDVAVEGIYLDLALRF